MTHSLSQRLAGKTAVVTGGGSGIGQAIAQRFASEGAEVIILELRAEAAEETLSTIQALGGNARAIICDILEYRIGPLGLLDCRALAHPRE